MNMNNCWSSDYPFETKNIVLETLAGNHFFSFLYQKYMISRLTFKIQTKIDSVSHRSVINLFKTPESFTLCSDAVSVIRH